ncbi:MAG: VTT domain-containing protein [Oscillospiraceae bacterium]|jgi:uncharacterized membrane protein YdjX (TVP38/TMEM64 family)|nr:VTT domain-containing protein [Oscillospiraceae bacterium]
MKKFQLKRKVEARDWVNFGVILLVAGLFVWLGMTYLRFLGSHSGQGDLLTRAQQLREIIEASKYRGWGLVILTGLHALHVVISVIPAGLVQFCGALMYRFWTGLIIGMIGSALGTAISFYLSRLLGRRVLTLLVSEKNIKKVETLLEGNTSTMALLILYALPTPKDFFAYFLGLTNLKARKVFLISLLGRIPGMLATTYLGAHIVDRNYVVLGGIVALCVLLAAVSFFLRDKILPQKKTTSPEAGPESER